MIHVNRETMLPLHGAKETSQRSVGNLDRRTASTTDQVVVRFWIITMLLVLFGLSTLKLR